MKKYLKGFILIITIFSLLGCSKTSEKIKKLNEKMSIDYNNYSLLNSHGSSDESGGDYLTSVAKIDDKYVLVESFFNNKELYSYDVYELLDFYKVNNNLVVAETEYTYSNSSKKINLVIVYNKDAYNRIQILSEIENILLEYGKKDLEYMWVYIYNSSTINNEMDLYKEFAMSQVGKSNGDFYKDYKKKLNIISDIGSYEFGISTESTYKDEKTTVGEYITNYKSYINRKIADKLSNIN